MARAKTAAPAATPATPAVDPATALLIAALGGGTGQSNDDRFMAIVADETAGVVNGITEVAGRSFGGVPTVWAASRKAGKLDGMTDAKAILARSAKRAGMTLEQAAQIIAHI